MGRLEDSTTACLTTFHHSADTFKLNNEDGSLCAVPQLDPPPLLAIEYQPGNKEKDPPYGVGCWKFSHTFRGGARTPLLLQWQEGTHTEPLGNQNSSENPDSLGLKRSYAPFVSADGTQPSQVGNQTRPPNSEPQPDPPPGVMGFGVGRDRSAHSTHRTHST